MYELIWMSRPLMQAAEANVEQGLRGTGVTVRMRAVLEILHAQGDATVPEIAHALEIKRQYVQLMVNDTLADGLVRKIANPRHKRSTLISLTERGRALIEGVVRREMELVHALGDDLTTDEVETAHRVVTRLLRGLKSQVQRPDP
ncbi:MarR family transcriptional regulator [uncultured Tateyamaria sp.]|uniref:MarR family winged helix-turn-helix transcriptional regulator n=1 Tax=Tateyamaria sp. 1078 TaxID=3417464 RepID=UPI002616A63E|nr:MarR family transcriptional regulator [uncultured Tateyamaria sp.]